MRIHVGTRKSRLALAQTQLAIESLKKFLPDLETQIVPISTRGDQDVQTPLYQMPMTGVFIKEIEQALIDHTIDLAVHSLKDVSSISDDRLMLLPFTVFEDKRDALISKDHQSLMELKNGARIATSSIRRMACIHQVRPDIEFVSIRGNIDTRLEKFKEMDLDGIVLAMAGLKRLSKEDLVDEILDPSILVPACGQGTLVLQIRKEDRDLYAGLPKNTISQREVEIEREFLSLCNTGCHDPVGCMIQFDHDHILAYACLGTSMEDICMIHEVLPMEKESQTANILYEKVQEKRR